MAKKFSDRTEVQVTAVILAIGLFFFGLTLTKSAEFLPALAGWALVVVPLYLLGQFLYRKFVRKESPASEAQEGE